jgi:hypothetical protein
MNPAALNALVQGDIDNFLAAATPGGIERQEAAGQAALVASNSKLPKDAFPVTRDQITKGTGIVFGDDFDDLFVNVTLPPGWKLKPTDHSMWSDLLDDKGRIRAGVFYKAAFYDRKAHMNFNCRYRVDNDYQDPETIKVVDTATNEVLHVAGQCARSEHKISMVLQEAAAEWMYENYPDCDNPFAYWD